jgi:hypothetical protein
MKVLCLIGHGLYEPWVSIASDGQEKTWLAKTLPKNFEVLHVHGKPVSKSVLRLSEIHDNLRWRGRFVSTLLRGSDLLFTLPLYGFSPKIGPSSLLEMRHPVAELQMWDLPIFFRWKVRASLRYALSVSDFDYLFMTTTSSYIYPRRLMEIVSGLPPHRFVGGAVIYPGANFVPGSNRLFSRDVIENFIDDFWAQPASNLEDVSMSKSLKRMGYSVEALPHLPLTSVNEVRELKRIEAQKHYHFRVKSGPLSQRNDVAIMHALDKKLQHFGFFE